MGLEGESELMIEIGEGQLDSAVGIFRSGGFEVFRSVLKYFEVFRSILKCLEVF